MNPPGATKRIKAFNSPIVISMNMGLQKEVECTMKVVAGDNDTAEIMEDGIKYNGSYRGSRC
jgi:hypothetical protein